MIKLAEDENLMGISRLLVSGRLSRISMVSFHCILNLFLHYTFDIKTKRHDRPLQLCAFESLRPCDLEMAAGQS